MFASHSENSKTRPGETSESTVGTLSDPLNFEEDEDVAHQSSHLSSSPLLGSVSANSTDSPPADFPDHWQLKAQDGASDSGTLPQSSTRSSQQRKVRISSPMRQTDSSQRSLRNLRSGDSGAFSSCLGSRRTKSGTQRSPIDGEESLEFASQQTMFESASIKNGKGAIVDIHLESFGIEAFEIEESAKSSDKLLYTFNRSARRSVLLDLGVVAEISPESSNEASVCDPYTKATEQVAMTMYLAVIVGFGSLKMPGALRDCGVIPGILAIVFFGGVNLFMAHRLIDIPQLVQENMELYADMAHYLFHRFWSVFMGIMIVTAWSGACLMMCWSTMHFANVHNIPNHFIRFLVEVVIVAALVSMALRTDARRLRTIAGWSVKSMIAFFVCVAVASTIHGINNCGQLWASNKYNIDGRHDSYARTPSSGFTSIGVAFGGLAILPYIVSDMLHPQRAKAMMNKAVARIIMFYVAVAIFGYFGWGADVTKNIVKTIEQTDVMYSPYWWLAKVIGAILAFKSFLTFPILVWPLFRELDSYLKLETAPPIALGLPWAINNFSKWKTGVRVCLVVCTYLAYKFGPEFKVVEPLGMIPFHLCQLIVLPLFSIVAIKLHRDRVCQLPDRLSGRTAPDDDRQAIFGDRAGDLPRAILIGLVSMILGCIMMYIDLSRAYEYIHYRIEGGVPNAAAGDATLVAFSSSL